MSQEGIGSTPAAVHTKAAVCFDGINRGVLVDPAKLFLELPKSLFCVKELIRTQLKRRLIAS